MTATKKPKSVPVAILARVSTDKQNTAHKFLEEMEALGVSLYWHSQRIETLLSNGKRNPAASIMFSLLAEMARNERETLVERINSGLAKARREGKKLGRPAGSTLSPKEFLANHTRRRGASFRRTGNECGPGCAKPLAFFR